MVVGFRDIFSCLSNSSWDDTMYPNENESPTLEVRRKNNFITKKRWHTPKSSLGQSTSAKLVQAKCRSSNQLEKADKDPRRWQCVRPQKWLDWRKPNITIEEKFDINESKWAQKCYVVLRSVSSKNWEVYVLSKSGRWNNGFTFKRQSSTITDVKAPI